MADTVSDAGNDRVADPLVGEMLSQEPPAEVSADAMKLSDPPPASRTCTVWLTALLAWLAVKLTLGVSTASDAGVGGCTVNVTGMDVVAGDALGTVRMIAPWYEPGTRADGSAVTS